ncbi:hypothetical protein Glove_165g75 [Diversispora epigaea]|uniref:Uncharacterized protein n=1 Tax=Diversispora epigaea TaxID=1348612 RepID=A0A397IR39_9GLOM|nr:hypothetical protein Glove_165g75 [Diversispora epigaea]
MLLFYLQQNDKKIEALQELVQIKPDIKGKEIFFFLTQDKFFKGVIMYDKKEKKAYVYCIKSNHKFETFSKWINLKSQSYQRKIILGEEFSGTAIQEISGGLEFRFATIDEQSEKKLLIFSKNGLHSYEVRVFNKVVQDVYLPFPINTIERTLGFEDIIHIRETQLVNKEINHTPFALMKKNGQVYRRVDCTLVIKENITCKNCSKLKKLCNKFNEESYLK